MGFVDLGRHYVICLGHRNAYSGHKNAVQELFEFLKSSRQLQGYEKLVMILYRMLSEIARDQF